MAGGNGYVGMWMVPHNDEIDALAHAHADDLDRLPQPPFLPLHLHPSSATTTTAAATAATTTTTAAYYHQQHVPGQPVAVNSVALHPNQAQLVSGDQDGRVRCVCVRVLGWWGLCACVCWERVDRSVGRSVHPLTYLLDQTTHQSSLQGVGPDGGPLPAGGAPRGDRPRALRLRGACVAKELRKRLEVFISRGRVRAFTPLCVSPNLSLLF